MSAIEKEKDVAKRAAMDDAGSSGREVDQRVASVRSDFARRRTADEAQRKALSDRLARLSPQNRLDEMSAKRDTDKAALSQQHDNRRLALSQDRERMEDERARILSQTKDANEPRRKSLEEQRERVARKYEEQQSSAVERYNQARGELATREDQVREKQTEMRGLEDTTTRLRAEINKIAQGNQIYRIAALWWKKDDAAEITNDELRVVTFVWFGSLAAITAWTGTLLAFAGLVMRYPRPRARSAAPSPLVPTVKRAAFRFFRSLRALTIARRKALREPKIEYRDRVVEKPVEVVREVPVTKVQTEYREVPVEIIRKEIVYVPFFSDDPELLSSQKITSADVAVSAMRGGHGPRGKSKKPAPNPAPPAPVAPSSEP